MINRIRLFNKSSVEMLVSDEEYVALVGDHVVMAMLEKPTREETLCACELGRKAHWAFPGGNGVDNAFSAVEIIDELLVCGALDEEEYEAVNVEASCRPDTRACRAIIRAGQDAGLWIRTFEYRGKDLAFTDPAGFDPMKHGIAWLEKRALDRLFKGVHKAADQEAELLLARISEAEQAGYSYTIYAGRGKKLGAAAWREPEKLTRIASDIDMDDIEEALEKLTPEAIERHMALEKSE